MTDQQATDTSTELTWFKSTYSGTDGGECVEVATAIRATHVRDSKAIGPMLTFQSPSWSVFLTETTNRVAS